MTSDSMIDGDPAWAQLSEGHRRAGLRVTATGLVCGTPRTDVDDPRFDRSRVRAAAFAPHAATVWSVLDQITWWGMVDATRLLVAAGKLWGTGINWAHAGDRYETAQAARAAGPERSADWDALDQIVDNLRAAVLPEVAAFGPGHYSRAKSTWDDAFGLALNTARAALVADRPELTPSAHRWLTGPWLAVYPDSPVGEPRHLTTSATEPHERTQR